MRSKYLKYIVSSVMILSGVQGGGILKSVFAQESAQTRTISGGERDDLQWQLKQMEESLKLQQEQIQALKSQIETAPAKEEIKKEVDNYMASDDARKKMMVGMPSFVTSEYTPDDEKYALGLKSNDGKYSLNVGGRMQFRYTFEDNDEDFNRSDKQDVTLRRARLYMGGNIYSKMVHYYVEADCDSFTFGMRDFYVYWDPIHELNAKIGYFKVPFNQQRMTTSAKLLLQDRAIASEQFDQDRDYGLDIYGKPFDGYMEYHASVFQGAGEKAIKGNTDNELMYVFNVRFNPLGKYDTVDESDLKYTEHFRTSVAASVVINPKKTDVKLADSDGIMGVAELSMKYRGASWHNEYYMRSDDPESGAATVQSNGFFSQAGYFVMPKKLEFAVRYSMLDPDTDAANDLQREYTGGVNYYFKGHRSKIQTDVGHFVTEKGSSNDLSENRIRMQYQIMF